MKRQFSNNSASLFKNAKFDVGISRTSSIIGKSTEAPNIEEYFPDNVSSIVVDNDNVDESGHISKPNSSSLDQSSAASDEEEDVEIENENPLASVEDIFHQKVFESSDLSLNDYCILLISYQRKHRLSDAAINDLCKLINRLLPSPNNCPRSSKIASRIIESQTKSMFGNICSVIQKVCTSCGLILSNEACQNCLSEVGRPRKPGFYFNCNIMRQLTIILTNHGDELLRYLKEAQAIRNGGQVVSDIITGELYCKRYPYNPDGSSLFLNLLINADGARFTKSKCGSFWPVLAELVELPKKIRCKFSNVLLLAIWQGETKPNWEVLLRKCVDELLVLSTIGFSATISGVMYHIQVNVIATVLDAPARASFWNVTQFNGEYGCMNCLQKGDYQNHRRLWPYDDTVELKTTEWYKSVLQRFRSGDATTPVYGIKGLSMMDELRLDPCAQNPIDFMHQAYEGNFSRILDVLFGSGRPWSLGRGKTMKQVDQLVANIRFPSDYQRTIPPLDDFKSYKASEMKNLLLYGLIPTATQNLNAFAMARSEAADFMHWIMLYHEICASLNVDQIRLEQFDLTQKLVAVWLQLLPIFMGKESQSFNAHCTQHLVYYARQLGPLHNYSTFSFESCNGMLSKLVTSANGPINQVSRRFLHEKCMRIVDSKIKEFFDETNSSSLNPVQRFDRIKTFGISKFVEMDKDEFECISLTFPSVKRDDIVTVSAAKVGSLLIKGEISERSGKCCTHIAKFLEHGRYFYAIISRIVIVENNVLALCRELTQSHRLVDQLVLPSHPLFSSLFDNDKHALYGSFFHIVEDKSLCRIVYLDFLQCRCILVRRSDSLVLMEEIMQYEHN